MSFLGLPLPRARKRGVSFARLQAQVGMGNPQQLPFMVLALCEPREAPRQAGTGPPGAGLTRPQGSVARRAAPGTSQGDHGLQPGSQHVTFQTPPEELLTWGFLVNSILSSVAAACLGERGRGIWAGGSGRAWQGSLWTPCGFWAVHRCHSHPLLGTPAHGLLLYSQGARLPRWLSSKESVCSAGDPSSIPGSGRFPGRGNGNPHQYPCLENPMDRGAWRASVHGVTKSQTRLRDGAHTRNGFCIIEGLSLRQREQIV